jgi:hypothetical protein
MIRRRLVFFGLLNLVMVTVAVNHWLSMKPSRETLEWQYKTKYLEWRVRMLRDSDHMIGRWHTGKTLWTKEKVERLIDHARSRFAYEKEEKEYWKTPKELAKDHFFGDCEDFVIFMMWQLKEVKYPWPVRVRIVNTIGGGPRHATLRAKLPNGRWKTYQFYPPGGIKTRLRDFLSVALLEFDLDRIYYL